MLAALMAVGMSLPSPVPVRPVVSAPQAGSPVPILNLPGDTQGFTGYDFRQKDFGDVDWPVAFIFRGQARVEDIQDALCHRSRSVWKYCTPGAELFLYHSGTTPLAGRGFARNGGVKRFSQSCTTNSFTAHIRLYALRDGGQASPLPTTLPQAVVVGTAHLDFQDRGGCSGRIHGFPDVAEQWLREAMQTMDGWTVTPRAWNLGNGGKPYVVLRESGDIEIPHVFGQDGLATDVYIR